MVRRVLAKREVILAAGAFNTPQLLMLSGIGPPEELARHGIEARVALDGVGRNLQDRYEVGVVDRAHRPWASLAGVEFAVGDPAYRAWEQGDGMYASNGAAVAFTLRSKAARGSGVGSRPLRDGSVDAVLRLFHRLFRHHPLKSQRPDLRRAQGAHQQSRRPGASLALSILWRDPPAIDFRGFEEGTDASGEDLDAVIEGVERVRRMAAKVPGILAPEDTPGAELRGSEPLKDLSGVTPGATTPHAPARSARKRREGF